jgi:hypothetical protein
LAASSTRDRLRRLARPVLAVAALVGVLWLGPKLRGRIMVVEVEIRNTTCVEGLSVSMMKDQELQRRVLMRPEQDGKVRDETRLPEGKYRLVAALRCEDGEVRTVLERPVEITDDLAIPVTVTATCGCAGKGD